MYRPHSWQLELVERGFGQYLTLADFGAGLREDHAVVKADKEQAPEPVVGRSRECRAKDEGGRARAGVLCLPPSPKETPN